MHSDDRATLTLSALADGKVSAKTPDGYLVEITMNPDLNGRVPLLVSRTGWSAATSAPDHQAALMVSAGIIDERRRVAG